MASGGERRIMRVLEIIRALSDGNPQSIESLIALTQRSRRTVFRDLRLLADVGYVASVRNPICVNASSKAEDAHSWFTVEEADALTASVQLLLQGDVLPDPTVAHSALTKLLGLLPDHVRQHCEGLDRKLLVRPEPHVDPVAVRDVFRAIQRCLIADGQLTIKFVGDVQKTARTVHIQPVCLIHVDRAWQVMGFIDRETSTQLIPLHRILHCRPFRSKAAPLPNPTVDDFFANAWRKRRAGGRFDVVLRFDPTVVDEVGEVNWHRSQILTWADDGGLVFEVEVDGLEEISRWVLGFGSHVHVVAPTELREMIVRQVIEMSEHYECQEPSDSIPIQSARGTNQPRANRFR